MPTRLLIIAEACNPAWVSVPLVGYNFARALAERTDLQLTIVTHIRNRPAIAASDLGKFAAVEYIDNELIAAPIYRLAKALRGGDQLGWTTDTALAWPGYVAFEHLLARQFARRLSRGEFDLIHRITPLSPTAVSPLASRTSVPMIVGPLNGGLPWPKEFRHLARQEGEWLAPLRGAYKLLPYYRRTYRCLAGVISGSRSTAAEIPRHFRGQRFTMPENGVDPLRFPISSHWASPSSRFRFVTVGRLVPYKGLSLTLEAMGRSTNLRQCELVIIGDGPDRAEHEAFVDQHGLRDNVVFRGQLSQPELAHELRQAQAFVFPSLREFGGGVVLEAMASALPCIVVDYGGPGELVNTTTGIKLPIQSRELLVGAIQDAMEALADDPDRCRRLGETGAAEVTERYTWSAKARQLVGIYQSVIAGRLLNNFGGRS